MIDATNLAVLSRLSGVSNERHADKVRGFVQLTRTWYYRGSPTVHLKDGDTDEISIGFYDQDWRVTSGEFVIRFKQLSDRAHPQLCVFDDAWNALVNMPDLLIWLGQKDDRYNSTSITPDDLVKALLEMGFQDFTKEERD